MVSVTPNHSRRLAYVGAGATALWLLVLFLVVPNMASMIARIGIRATLLIVFIPLAVAAVSLFVSTYRSWVSGIRSRALRQMALAFFWSIVVAFGVAGVLFILLVIVPVDSGWTFSWK